MPEELIDLNKMTQRDLLIRLHENVKDLKQDMKDTKASQQKMELKVNSLETRSKVWGSVSGFFAAIGTVIVEALFVNR